MCINRWFYLIGILSLASAVHADVAAKGGDVTNHIGGYCIHTFLNNGTFTVASGGKAEVLVVAGGGGGGKWVGGAGGAGGFQTNAAFQLLPGTYVVEIGVGGAKGADGNGPGECGGDSVFSNGASFIVSKGGGGGGTHSGVPATVGGSGGGAGGNTPEGGAAGIAGQGNHGGKSFDNQWGGGGGGGAGGPGADATAGQGGAGGAGLASSISGTNAYYAGGGGGCSDGNNAGSNGGMGGGGKGRSNSENPPHDGTPNTGGGGGGARDVAPAGCGGSGIVIIKYYLRMPIIDNANGATNVTQTSACLNSTLSSTGTSATAVYVFWGPVDGGTNGGLARWANTVIWPAPQKPGNFTKTVTGLATNAVYFYRFAASNAACMSWSPESTFFMTGEAWVDSVTALLTAATKGQLDVVKLLINKGADINARGKSDKTALTVAASAGRWDMVKYLVEKGADINATGENDKTALMVAANAGRWDMVKYLVEKGANVNTTGENDKTALMVAADKGQLDVVRFLVEKGADVNAKNQNGKTALMITSHPEVSAFLRQHGAE